MSNRGRHRSDTRIAIVGAACRFPGAASPEALWQNVLAGRREFRRVPAERFPLEDYFDPDPATPDRTYSDQVAVITGWAFDAPAFGIPPVTARASDTTHWLALETAAGAVADAGIDTAAEDRSRIRVVIGNSLGGEYARATYLRYRWPYVERAMRRALGAGDAPGARGQAGGLLRRMREHYLAPFPPVSEDSLAGTMSNTIAGRICNHFDLGGGGYTVDGACASSLLAVHQACDALVRDEIDVAICGGVDISLDPYELIGFAKAQALAEDDIRPYDERARGMLPGEGCGILVLTRLRTAREQELRVRAVIRGWGISTDGRGGITAPTRDGQVRAIRRAYLEAGFSLGEVQLLEGHGTGTTLGDEVELGALLEVLGDAPPRAAHPLRIGSIKGNIGHCKAAAGAAGLIKTMLALENRTLPPSAGCERPHPLFGRFDRLAPLLDCMAWEATPGPRRAGVSAFGFGGCNAHIVLEEDAGGASPAAAVPPVSAQASELVVLSAPSAPALRARLDQVRERAATLSRAELVDLAASLAASDDAGRFRVALVATSPRDLVEQLGRARRRIRGERIVRAGPGPEEALAIGRVDPEAVPRLVALFPGQGAQRIGMARHLERRYPFVRELLDRLDEAVVDIVPAGVARWIRAEPRTLAATVRGVQEAELEQTDVAQPAIVAASLATLAVLEHHGLRADAVAGHSLGEITALSAAGAYSARQAIRIAALRGRAMAEVDLDDPGAMAMVGCAADEPEMMTAGGDGGLEIACFNAPRETVVCGDTVRIEALGRECHGRGVAFRRLPVSHAFHSRRMARAAEALRAAVGAERSGSLDTPMVSGVSGDWLTSRPAIGELLAEQLTAPVRFTAIMERLRELRPALWLEIGPGAALSRLAGLCAPGASALPTERMDEDGFTQLNHVLARAYVLGLPVATRTLFAHRDHRPLADGPLEVIASPCEGGPATAPPSPDAVAGPGDARAGALAFVIGWIANRTGYPAGRIEPWMRLRDDLNLDSIKAMELLQVLTARYGRVVRSWQQWENMPVGELVDAFLRMAAAGQRDGDGAGLLGARVAFEPGDGWVRSFGLRPVEVPLDCEPREPRLEPASIFVVGERRDRRARAVIDHLVDAGYAPVWVSIGQVLRGRVKPVPLGAVVTLAPGEGQAWWAADDETSGRARSVADRARRWLELARWCAAVAGERGAPLRWLVLRPSNGALRAGAPDAGAGLLKALRLENPAVQGRWVRVPESLAPAQWARIAGEELERAGARVEYAYDAAGRRHAEVAAMVPERSGPSALGAGDVVLATGAAMGITHELARTLAAETDARLAVVGRSSRRTVAVRKALAAFRADGVDARYFACDVTDAARVDALVARIGRQMGPIRGLLHGAGVAHPAWLSEIDLERWLECVRVKADGLANLVRACDPQELRVMHVIASVIGHTGMPRQLDYAFANAWLAGALEDIRSERTAMHALSLAYSVWDETGLGRKLGSVSWMKAFGITALPTAKGCAAYRDALRSPGDTPRRIIIGRLAQALESDLFRPPPPPRSRFLERWLRWIPGVEVAAEATIDAERDPYLLDHVFEGTVMLPAVMGIDAMVAAAMSCLDRDDLPVVRDIELRRPVVIPPGARVALRVFALVERDAPARVRVALRTETDDFSSDCFSGWCHFDEAAPRRRAPKHPAMDLATPLGPRPDDPLFQGPTFRWLTALRYRKVNREALAEARIHGQIRYFGEKRDAGVVTPHPAARDAFLQTILLMLEGRGLPTAIAELRFHRRPRAGSTVLVHARKVRARGERRDIDIEVRDDEGRLVETLRGVRVEPVRRPHALERVDVSGVCRRIAARWPDDALGVGIASVAGAKRPGEGAGRAAASRANRLAVARALAALGERTGDTRLGRAEVGLEHDDAGRPRLALNGDAAGIAPELEVGITDTARLSVALVRAGPERVGLDLELVETRSDDAWRGLLGPTGYALALRLAGAHFRDLSTAATCAWTVVECARKSGRVLPAGLEPSTEGPWVVLGASAGEGERYASLVLAPTGGLDTPALLTISLW